MRNGTRMSKLQINSAIIADDYVAAAARFPEGLDFSTVDVTSNLEIVNDGTEFPRVAIQRQSNRQQISQTTVHGNKQLFPGWKTKQQYYIIIFWGKRINTRALQPQSRKGVMIH